MPYVCPWGAGCVRFVRSLVGVCNLCWEGRRDRHVYVCFFRGHGCVCSCYQSMCRCKGMFGASSKC